jgi:hypothetical protein
MFKTFKRIAVGLVLAVGLLAALSFTTWGRGQAAAARDGWAAVQG